MCTVLAERELAKPLAIAIIYPTLTVNGPRAGDREAEGAALEMLCTACRTVGSNPTPSAQRRQKRRSECRAFFESGSLPCLCLLKHQTLTVQVNSDRIAVSEFPFQNRQGQRVGNLVL